MARGRILFLDNDENFLDAQKRFLTQLEFEVFAVTNWISAREVLDGQLIDLIVLNRHFEDDFLRDPTFRLLPRIIVLDSTSLWRLLQQKFYRYRSILPHAVDYLTKELESDEIYSAIQNALADITNRQRRGYQGFRHPLLASRKVFLVYGHDGETKREVQQFLSRLGLTPIVFDELPTEGRTIIELIEDHAAVDFAVALLTPDDVAYSRRQPEVPLDRARQNVVLELGYFMAKLGRRKVRALRKGDIENPSDLHGIIYIQIDQKNEDWTAKLARELKHEGFKVDLNNLP